MIDAAKSARSTLKAQKWRDYYAFKEACLLLTNIINPMNGTIMFSRDLDYGFSLTSHKSQGSTYKQAIINIKNIEMNPNKKEKKRLLYTAITRASDLVILYNV